MNWIPDSFRLAGRNGSFATGVVCLMAFMTFAAIFVASFMTDISFAEPTGWGTIGLTAAFSAAQIFGSPFIRDGQAGIIVLVGGLATGLAAVIMAAYAVLGPRGLLALVSVMSLAGFVIHNLEPSSGRNP